MFLHGDLHEKVYMEQPHGYVAQGESAQKVKSYLQQHFQMKDLGALGYFLGIEVVQSKKGLRMLGGYKPVDTPMDPNVKFGASNEKEFADKHQYRRLAGKLVYLTVTRPDISYVVDVISQFMESPKQVIVPLTRAILLHTYMGHGGVKSILTVG
ncbi:uncharacterized mitochondrial protein AtMg00810-like [Telopea speciosissima]|uniref:uncharacterized mitochondrial protein AtMg00810-like n=1 Tax=Telopea speciosissima TaxID=54955 RepID=UPI001CC75DF5|nr:uncharacterized mitochondrial protein AtMg00810-like [Telopea speciosissima]